MSEYSATINWYTFLLSFDNLDYQLLNDRGYFKMLEAFDHRNMALLQSSIRDLELSLKAFRNVHPFKIYYIGLANLKTAMDLQTSILTE